MPPGPSDLCSVPRDGESQFLYVIPCHGNAAPQKLHTHPLDKCNKNAFKARQDKVTAQSLSASVLGELWRTEGLEAAECWVPAENSSLLCLPLAPPHRLGQGREGAARGPAPLGG